MSDDEDFKELLDAPQSNNLGRSETVVSPDAATPAPTVTLINASASDRSSRCVVVTLDTPELENRDLASFDVVGARPFAIAIVEWGSGGHQNIAEIDYARGAQFTVEASALRVKARLDPLVNGGISTIPIKVAATLGYGTRPGPLRGPARTIPATPVPVLAGTTSNFATIPRYARSGTLLVTPLAIPAETYRVDIRDFTGALIAQFVGTANDLWRIPVPNGAFVWSVFNGGAAPATFRMMWDLAL